MSFFVIGQEIDGTSFLELTMDELNKLFPEKLGTVKKVYRLIQSVSVQLAIIGSLQTQISVIFFVFHADTR